MSGVVNAINELNILKCLDTVHRFIYIFWCKVRKLSEIFKR